MMGTALLHDECLREREVPVEIVGPMVVRRVGRGWGADEPRSWYLHLVRVDGEGGPRLVDASRVRAPCVHCGELCRFRVDSMGKALPRVCQSCGPRVIVLGASRGGE